MRRGSEERDLPATEALVRFLMSPATHRLHGETVRLVETHGAYVFLAGATAYKMKKPVDLGYFDFTTLAEREADSRREVALNRRTAPHIYRRVVAVTRNDEGELAIGGDGEPVEWLVEMARFDERQVLDAAVARDARVLSFALVEKLAAAIAAFHQQAERTTAHGGAAAAAEVVRANGRQFDELGDVLDPAVAGGITSASLKLVDREARRLDVRRDTGFVRRCHGDLHLGNIVLIDGAPVPFDCIEFSDDFACIDVLYDLAFLVMDLDHRGFGAPATLLLGRYILSLGDEEAMADLEGLALLPLFLSCRAAIRAHVTARQSRNASLSESAREEARQNACGYLAAARRYLEMSPPALVAIGGLSGTGKSALARALAPKLGSAPGALVLRSDELRKRRFGVAPSARLPEGAYGSDTSAAVYEDQRRFAAAALAAGRSVIADAVFARPDEREAIEAAAIPHAFTGLWLEAPREVLEERIRGRSNDASDASVAVLERQLSYDLGPMIWRKIDASPDIDAVVRAAEAEIRR